MDESGRFEVLGVGFRMLEFNVEVFEFRVSGSEVECRILWFGG